MSLRTDAKKRGEARRDKRRAQKAAAFAVCRMLERVQPLLVIDHPPLPPADPEKVAVFKDRFLRR